MRNSLLILFMLYCIAGCQDKPDKSPTHQSSKIDRSMSNDVEMFTSLLHIPQIDSFGSYMVLINANPVVRYDSILFISSTWRGYSASVVISDKSNSSFISNGSISCSGINFSSLSDMALRSIRLIDIDSVFLEKVEGTIVIVSEDGELKAGIAKNSTSALSTISSTLPCL